MTPEVTEPGERDASPPFRSVLRAEAAEAARVREDVVRFCEASGVPGPAVEDVALALAEALDNAIEHGVLGRPNGELVVEAAVEPGWVRLEVRDRGEEFDPTKAPDLSAVPLEERRFGGFGLKLVRSLVDEMRYERRDGENRLRLAKRIARG